MSNDNRNRNQSVDSCLPAALAPAPPHNADELAARLRSSQRIRLAPDGHFRPVQETVDRAVAEAWVAQRLEQQRLQAQW